MQKVIAQREGNVIDAQKETNKLQEIIQEVTEQRDILSQDLSKLQAVQQEQQMANEKYVGYGDDALWELKLGW